MAKYSSVFNLNSGYTLYLEVTETDVSIDKNSSKVKWTLTIESTKSLEYGSFDYDGTPFSISINNVVVSSGEKTYDFGEYKTLKVASGTTNFIQHNTDGSKTVACSATFGASDTPIGKATAKGNLVLTKIPRISTFSVSTEKTKVEDIINLTIISASTSFTYKIGWYYNNKLIGTISSVKNLKPDITVPTTLYKTFLENNKNSLKFVLKCGTYSGNTYIGVATKEIVVELSANKCKPIIQKLEIVNINDVKIGEIRNKTDGSLEKIVLKNPEMGQLLNVKATYTYNSSSYIEAVKSYNKVEELTYSFSNAKLDDLLEVSDNFFTSNKTALSDENKYLYYTAPTIKINTPSVNFETVMDTQNGELNYYKITEFVASVEYNFLDFVLLDKTNSSFSYKYYLGINNNPEDNGYSEILKPEGNNQFTIVEPTGDNAINLDELLQPFYLIIKYTDGVLEEKIEVKEIRISSLFDWNQDNFNFNVPITINRDQKTGQAWYSITTKSGGGLDMKNSDIIQVNSIYFGDESSATGEGLGFLHSDVSGGQTQTYDYFKSYGGHIWYIPNFPTNKTGYRFNFTSGDSIPINENNIYNCIYNNGSFHIMIPFCKIIAAQGADFSRNTRFRIVSWNTTNSIVGIKGNTESESLFADFVFNGDKTGKILGNNTGNSRGTLAVNASISGTGIKFKITPTLNNNQSFQYLRSNSPLLVYFMGSSSNVVLS